jgi:spore coat protein CotH
MSLTQLKDEAAHLPSKEQRELIAFLVALQTTKNEEFKKKLAARIDDRDPANWMDVNDLQKRYAE